LNSTPSRVLPNNLTPSQVWNEPDVYEKLVDNFKKKKREDFLKKIGYPKRFSFGLNDLVKLRADEFEKGIKFKKASRGEIWGFETWRIVKRFAYQPHQYSLVDSQDRYVKVHNVLRKMCYALLDVFLFL
jgi:hypothetical protein